MEPEEWRRIEELLKAALDRDPEELRELVDRLCAARLDAIRVFQPERAPRESELPSPANFLGEAVRILRGGEPAAFWPGERLGRFEIKEELGRGGKGQVYLAEDAALRRLVALKTLNPAIAKDPDAKERFQIEARSAARLNHPNVVTIYDIYEWNGILCISSEYVKGITLRQRLERLEAGRVTLDDALSICVQIADGVAAAHRQGIVHRDLKPENVMISEDGPVKVLDFGIAALAAAGAEAFASLHNGAVFLTGTHAYMSPERLAGERAEPSSDVWSLGVILFELACGVHPFSSPASPAETSVRIHRAELPAMPAEVPPPLEAVIRKATAKDPSERYQTAGQMAGGLREVRLEQPGTPIDLQLVPSTVATLDGAWEAEVTYDPLPTFNVDPRKVTEAFSFEVDGEDVYGTASFYKAKMVLLEGKLKGGRLTFITRGRAFVGMFVGMSKEGEVTRRYQGRIVGDEIKFVMVSEGTCLEAQMFPAEFMAKRMSKPNS